jgi:hypothetical protein
VTASSNAVRQYAALLIVAVSVFSAPARTESASADRMECRHANQAWSPCRYVSEQPGARWELAFSNQVVRFQHDGSGTMQMQIGDQTPWAKVQARWSADGTLCWNTVCARGDIPLD